MESHDSHEMAQKLITNLARKCVAKLPPGSGIELDDVVQEGWIVYWKVVTTSRVRHTGQGNFPGLLATCLKNEFGKIVRKAHWPRNAMVEYGQKVDELSTVQDDPERQLMVAQALGALAEVNPELAQYIAEGPGRLLEVDILAYVIANKHDRWSMQGLNFRPSAELFKKIFKFDKDAIALYGYI